MSSPLDGTPTDSAALSSCSLGQHADGLLHLRIAGIFIILLTSSFGALFPVFAKRSTRIQVPRVVFEFTTYFGSGVIIGTAFIHLLGPAMKELSSECLSTQWTEYPYALAFCLFSIFSIFIVELIAFRWGTEKLKKLGVATFDHHHGPTHTTETHLKSEGSSTSNTPPISDIEAVPVTQIDIAALNALNENTLAQIVGVAILEFGVVLHSILVGLTLAVDPDFKILFVVLVFHQTFEGLGVGTRLAFLKLSPKYDYIPILAGVVYGLTTPIGIAMGLAFRSTYNSGSATASIVSGIMDALSAGILIYTGLVELLAHEFLFNPEMMKASNGKLAFALCSMLLGVFLMALLGKWA